MRTFPDVRHVSVTILRAPPEVYAFAADPRNLPRWARGLSGSISQEGGEWIADSPMGKVRVRFAGANDLGVLDHDVVLPSGEIVHNPMRVVPNADGSEVVFTLFRRPGTSDEAFVADAAAVADDLRALKRLLDRPAGGGPPWPRRAARPRPGTVPVVAPAAGGDGATVSAPPALYGELASWFHVLTPPEDYAVEAAWYLAALAGATQPCATLLELGSGGGNNASHLKAHLRCTLTDVSPAMLAESRRLNPECEHLEADMRTLRLGRTFDAVLLHDAVMYLTSEDDLRRALETARVHLRPGGAVALAPDFVRETFAPATSHGGTDRGGRALRYLEWLWDPDPEDATFVADYVYALREGDGAVRVVHDRHVEGLFPRATWRRLLAEAGLEERTPPPHDPGEVGEVFLAVRPR